MDQPNWHDVVEELAKAHAPEWIKDAHKVPAKTTRTDPEDGSKWTKRGHKDWVQVQEGAKGTHPDPDEEHDETHKRLARSPGHHRVVHLAKQGKISHDDALDRLGKLDEDPERTDVYHHSGQDPAESQAHEEGVKNARAVAKKSPAELSDDMAHAAKMDKKRLDGTTFTADKLRADPETFLTLYSSEPDIDLRGVEPDQITINLSKDNKEGILAVVPERHVYTKKKGVHQKGGRNLFLREHNEALTGERWRQVKRLHENHDNLLHKMKQDLRHKGDAATHRAEYAAMSIILMMTGVRTDKQGTPLKGSDVRLEGHTVILDLPSKAVGIRCEELGDYMRWRLKRAKNKPLFTASMAHVEAYLQHTIKCSAHCVRHYAASKLAAKKFSDADSKASEHELGATLHQVVRKVAKAIGNESHAITAAHYISPMVVKAFNTSLSMSAFGKAHLVDPGGKDLWDDALKVHPPHSSVSVKVSDDDVYMGFEHPEWAASNVEKSTHSDLLVEHIRATSTPVADPSGDNPLLAPVNRKAEIKQKALALRERLGKKTPQTAVLAMAVGDFELASIVMEHTLKRGDA